MKFVKYLIATALATLVIYVALDKYTKYCEAERQARKVTAELNHMKKTARTAVVMEAINLLEETSKNIEEKSGIRVPSFYMKESELPSVFRYRLNNPSLFNPRNTDEVLDEVLYILDRAILFEKVVKKYPGATAPEYLDRYQNVHHRDDPAYAEIRSASAAYVRELKRMFDGKLREVDSLVTSK